jgi:hypothetical protein
VRTLLRQRPKVLRQPELGLCHQSWIALTVMQYATQNLRTNCSLILKSEYEAGPGCHESIIVIEYVCADESAM